MGKKKQPVAKKSCNSDLCMCTPAERKALPPYRVQQCACGAYDRNPSHVHCRLCGGFVGTYIEDDATTVARIREFLVVLRGGGGDEVLNRVWSNDNDHYTMRDEISRILRLMDGKEEDMAAKEWIKLFDTDPEAAVRELFAMDVAQAFVLLAGAIVNAKWTTKDFETFEEEIDAL